ncbi:MAG: 2-amino-4-hydroxy-6-hydroxymethyldihydropteridine diphosphokinase [Bacteroidales bacterium]|nr:2-amino-4-hydroxy-6-hydroxymethyldihydropteridine diphosphokinase [Bacteroidales bacterium]
MRDLVLLIGTNLGDRRVNIESAIDRLSTFFGQPVKRSSLYETEPWGYKDEKNYYNQAVVFSSVLLPFDVLHVCKAIEIGMGRIKTENKGYENRVIDIDIVLYGDIIMNEERLKIPHPQIPFRKFVLAPLNEIIPNFIHPENNKTIHELYLACEDKLFVKPLGRESLSGGEPVNGMQSLNYNYIAIEGCIGAGKTSLSVNMARDFNARLILEQYEDNPFLPKFYKDIDKYAFPLELTFLASRYKQLNEQLASMDLFKNVVIADYFLTKSFIFARKTLPDDMFKLYSTMFNIIKSKMPEPDLIVYLYLTVDNLLNNIHRRGREYEQTITADYLQSIQDGYFEYFKQQTDKRILIIDTNNVDFVNNADDYKTVVSVINMQRDYGIHKVIL